MQKELLIKVLAYFMIYVVWAGNFLGIALAIESIPPFLAIAMRFLLAGLFFFLISDKKAYSSRILRDGAMTGFCLNVLGTGALAWSEQYIPTGIAAVIVAAIPIWMILLDFNTLPDKIKDPFLLLAILIGIGGILLISLTKGSFDVNLDSSQFYISFMVLIAGTLAWSFGSLYSRKLPVQASLVPFLAVQMSFAGLGLLAMSYMVEDWARFELKSVSPTSWLALGYMVVFGSVLGYLSYLWLLRKVEPVKVGFYALVNPVIAIFLGWWLADEVVSLPVVGGACCVLFAVLLTHAKTYRLFRRIRN